jgi:hypothetical protein
VLGMYSLYSSRLGKSALPKPSRFAPFGLVEAMSAELLVGERNGSSHGPNVWILAVFIFISLNF